mmetsp:Transcript_141931/g.453773  ORF Transcript_141931/g.453773 Transcript_141931/m.453773 type:complete len:335 (-) Transcript_141931:118-1122(-)
MQLSAEIRNAALEQLCLGLADHLGLGRELVQARGGELAGTLGLGTELGHASGGGLLCHLGSGVDQIHTCVIGLLRRLGFVVHLVHARGLGLLRVLGISLHHIHARAVGLVCRLGSLLDNLQARAGGLVCRLGSLLDNLQARAGGLLPRLARGLDPIHADGSRLPRDLGVGLECLHACGGGLVLMVDGRLGVVQGLFNVGHACLLADKRRDYVQACLQVLRKSLLWSQSGGNLLSHTVHVDLLRQSGPDDLQRFLNVLDVCLLLYSRLGGAGARLHARHALFEAGDAVGVGAAGVRLRLHAPPLAAHVGNGPKRRHAEHRERRAPPRCGGGCARC